MSRPWVFSLSPLFLFSGCPPLRVQFQELSNEDLQMTDDPKAPGSAAVYLNLEETTKDPFHYHRFYGRAKGLADKGRIWLQWRSHTRSTGIKLRTSRRAPLIPTGTLFRFSSGFFFLQNRWR